MCGVWGVVLSSYLGGRLVDHTTDPMARATMLHGHLHATIDLWRWRCEYVIDLATHHNNDDDGNGVKRDSPHGSI